MMDTTLFNLVWQIGGGTIGIVVIVIGLARWLISRLDKVKEELSDDARERFNKATQIANRAHERLDDIPATFVRRDEVMEHFRRLEDGQTAMRTEQNARFDRLYELLGSLGAPSGK